MQTAYAFMLDSLTMIQATLRFQELLEMLMVIPGAGKSSGILTAETFGGYRGIHLYPCHMCELEFSVAW